MPETKDIKYVNTPPTNGIYEKAQKKWGVDFDKGIIFTYGNTIYSKIPLTPDLIVHETTHVRQHAEYKGGPKKWWDRYLEDDEFRLSQEVEAYKAQYKWFLKNEPDREKCHLALHGIALLLSGPMYGNLLPYRKVVRRIKFK